MNQNEREVLAELLRLAREEYLAGVEPRDGERRRRGEWLMDEVGQALTSNQQEGDQEGVWSRTSIRKVLEV